MSRSVLDSSAVLALLHHEAGDEIVWRLAPNALLSAVNAAEVQGKLIAEGVSRNDAWDAVLGSVQEIVAFDQDQAEATGSMLASTRSMGLSLGDRACLVLGGALRLPIYTADRTWTKLKVPVDIRFIR
jgi:ribonuclease VapC